MTNKELLCKLYKDILKFAGCDTDENGNIFIKMGTDEGIPLTVEGKKVVLPTENNLKSSDENIIIFHPLAESMFRQETPVSIRLRKCINTRLNIVIGLLARHLLNIISSTDLHKNLQPERVEIMTKLSNIDSDTVENFFKKFLMDKETPSDKNFIFIYIKKRATIKELDIKENEVEKIYSRGGIVSFPFYEKLKELPTKKYRVKDLKAYKDVFEYIFTDIHHTDFYNQGSSSRQAPTLVALLKTAVNIASILNEHIEKFKNFIPDEDILTFDLDFYEYFNKDNSEELLEKLAISVPPQNDSGGVIAEVIKSVKPEQPTIQQPQQDTTYKPFSNQPQPQVQPSAVGSDGRLDWNVVVNTNRDVSTKLHSNQFSNQYQTREGYGYNVPTRRQPGMIQNTTSGWYGGYGNRGRRTVI